MQSLVRRSSFLPKVVVPRVSRFAGNVGQFLSNLCFLALRTFSMSSANSAWLRLATNAMLDAPAGVEMFKKMLNEGQAGDNVGLLLRGIKREDVVRGQVICKPGSVKPHNKFEAEVYALTKEEGGRHKPFFSNYKPQFFFRTADITGRASVLSCHLETLIVSHPAICMCRTCLDRCIDSANELQK